MIPKSGRTAYKYMPANVKAEIDKLSHFIIDNNPQFKFEFDEICNIRRLYNEMLHSDEKNYGKLQLATFMGKLNDKIENSIGNSILKLIFKEQKSGHWNNAATFQISHDIEPPHGEPPDFMNYEPPHGEPLAIRKLYIS